MNRIHNIQSSNQWIKISYLSLAIMLSAAFLAGCSSAEEKEQEQEQEQEQGSDLVIPVSEVTETPSFYSVTLGDTDMEVIAVKASDGTIRTAFNTCQICYSSGRGYYELSGDQLVCQNCGNRFSVDQIQIESGGCNPWPIFDADKTVTDTSITISYDFLNDSEEIFSNWKDF